MTIATTIKTRVLSSLNLTKLITPETYKTVVVRHNAVIDKYKVIYRATVVNNDEYKDVNGVGRTEMDAFRKLNDSILNSFIARHPNEYNKIVEDTKELEKDDDILVVNQQEKTLVA